MTISEQIEFLWEKAYTDALGAGHADPFAYAAAQVAPLRAKLRQVERAQAPRTPRHANQAGRRQWAERRAAEQRRGR